MKTTTTTKISAGNYQVHANGKTGTVEKSGGAWHAMCDAGKWLCATSTKTKAVGVVVSHLEYIEPTNAEKRADAIARYKEYGQYGDANTVTAPLYSTAINCGLDIIKVSGEDEYCIGGRKCIFGSCVSSALRNGSDPIECVKREESRGHETHWCNAQSVCIDGRPYVPAAKGNMDHGQIIIFEGRLFKVEPRQYCDHPLLTKIDAAEYIYGVVFAD